MLKTEGELRDKAYRLSWWLLFAMLGAIGAVSIATPFLHVQYTQRWFTWPNMILTAPVPIAVAAVTVLLLRSLANKQDCQPFFLSLALFALSYAGLGISMCPYIVPQSITIWQAASPENSQVFMLFGVAILMPLISAIPRGPIGCSAARSKPGAAIIDAASSKIRARWRSACCGSRPFGSAASAPWASSPMACGSGSRRNEAFGTCPDGRRMPKIL